jgi:hypothetical protein
MTVKIYDPGSVIVVFGTLNLSGFSDGTMVRVERDEDAFTKKVGADGECTRTRNRNRCGSVTVTLMQSSASNLALAALLTADELTPGGTSILPITVKDNQGNSLHTALDAWIRKTPSAEYAKEVGSREWVIDTGKMVNIEGGN